MYRIVFPEGEEERVLRAASIIARKRIAKVILLGNIDRILRKLEKLKLRFNVSIVNPATATEKNVYMQKLYELRRKKGLTVGKAIKLIEDRNYFACMMLLLGDCDAVISGAVSPTIDVLRPALQIIKTKREIERVSGAMFMKFKNKDFLFTDVGIQINPNVEELADIARLSAKTFKKLTGKKAKVAMLSYSTKGSGKGESVEKVRKATILAKKRGVNVMGEIQLDAALVREVAKSKNVGFIDANVLIFPDLDSGNIGYKIAERIGKAKAIGMITLGLKKPVNDLSRGCSTEDIVNLAKVTVKQIKWQF